MKRIDLLDAARGLCVVLMVGYHLLYNLMAFSTLPSKFLYNPIMDFLQIFFASIFIIIAGISSNFSKNNSIRGLKLLALSIAITIITFIFNPSLYVVFGIIHFLGIAMLFYGLTEKYYRKLHLNITFPILLLVLFICLKQLLLNQTYNIVGLSIFGIAHPKFVSADYFPIFPWIFMFYIGIYLGGLIKDQKFPTWFYTKKVPMFPWIGRKALIIYMIHQPILVAITYFI